MLVGSLQQAQGYLDQGFALGFGGALTYERALRIRRLIGELPAQAHVLETDAPDIAPEWIARQRNEPMHLALGKHRKRRLEILARRPPARRIQRPHQPLRVRGKFSQFLKINCHYHNRTQPRTDK